MQLKLIVSRALPAALIGLLGCNPSVREPADGAWLVGHYLVCDDNIAELQQCGAEVMREVEFFDDGTLLSTVIRCGVPEAEDPDRWAAWHATSEGIAEITPSEGKTGVVMAGETLAEASAHRRDDDCYHVDADGIVLRDEPPEMTQGYVLFRGDFVYDSQGQTQCSATTVNYVPSGLPECPDGYPSHQ